VGAVAAFLSAIVGVVAGLVAGSVGGLADRVVTILVEMVLSIPTIVVGIVLTATLGQNMTNLVVILLISGWLGYARVVRLVTRQLMHSDFVTAAQASGAGTIRIARYHLFPNVLPGVIVLFFQQVAAVMLWEASLTYLGIGLPIERVSLGGMIKEGQQHVFDGWWIGMFPGAMIALAVIGFTLLADWLQEEFDPVRGRGRRVR
jgi:ABC-type dipeptide/oligopeptide/nickel transport system permease subunit